MATPIETTAPAANVTSAATAPSPTPAPTTSPVPNPSPINPPTECPKVDCTREELIRRSHITPPDPHIRRDIQCCLEAATGMMEHIALDEFVKGKYPEPEHNFNLQFDIEHLLGHQLHRDTRNSPKRYLLQPPTVPELEVTLERAKARVLGYVDKWNSEHLSEPEKQIEIKNRNSVPEIAKIYDRIWTRFPD